MTAKGSMTNEERLKKTIRFEKTDKILFAPAIMQFAATYAGITQQEFAEDPVKAEAAFEKTFVELGGWDIIQPSILLRSSSCKDFELSEAQPGRELENSNISQFVEKEVMLPEDYDFLIDNGFDALRKRLNERLNPNPPDTKQPSEEQRQAEEREAKRLKAEIEKWDARGIVTLMDDMSPVPVFDFFWLNRSFSKFPLDVRRMPDKIKAATKACLPELIAKAKKVMKGSRIRRIGVASARTSATFISAKQFEEFVLPSWVEFVWAMDDIDIDVVFHCDCDWTKFLHYFKEFPPKRCVLQLDGTTDIFKAREVLGDHMALHGDVPATLLTLGTPDQVFDYCKKLIEEIGSGGGYILSSGCMTPDNSKIENVRAMVKAGNELTWL